MPELLYTLQSQLSSWSPVLTPTAAMMIKVHAATVRIYDAIISSILYNFMVSVYVVLMEDLAAMTGVAVASGCMYHIEHAVVLTEATGL